MSCSQGRGSYRFMHCRVHICITAMESWDQKTILQKTGSALGRGILLILILPLLPALVFGYPLMPVLAMIGAGLIIESTAAPVGIAFGLSPLFVFYVLICTESGIFLCLYDIFDTLGHTSEPVARFLERSRQYAHGSATVEKYGILGLIPCVILIGVYANAPLAWVLGWREDHALILTILGYLPLLVITIWISTGLLQLNIPGLVHP
jgi:uncharacterized membrane protein